MKLGIDLLDYSTNFNGGKDQFLINLLEGFEKNGFSKNIILFLEFKNKNYLKKIIPGAEIRIVQKKEYLFSKILKRFKIVSKDSEINNFIFKSFFYRKIKYKYGVDILFFPKRKTGFLKSNSITVTNPHDLQPLINKKFNKNFLTYIMSKAYYYLDFNLRDYVISISK